jgi:hypothetical protein
MTVWNRRKGRPRATSPGRLRPREAPPGPLPLEAAAERRPCRPQIGTDRVSFDPRAGDGAPVAEAGAAPAPQLLHRAVADPAARPGGRSGHPVGRVPGGAGDDAGGSRARAIGGHVRSSWGPSPPTSATTRAASATYAVDIRSADGGGPLAAAPSASGETTYPAAVATNSRSVSPPQVRVSATSTRPCSPAGRW